MTEQLSVLALPGLDPAVGRIERTVTAGLSIAEIVSEVLPRASDDALSRARVWLVTNTGETLLSTRPSWGRIRPRAGVRVMIKLVPAGGDDLRNALLIAVSIGATALGQFWVGPAILKAGGSAILAGIGAAAATTGITPGGCLLSLDGDTQ